MTAQIQPRDWEALSAYLDNQITPKERKALEARIYNEPALKEALTQLERTRTILRSTPRLRTPRPFTLKSAMVGSMKRKGATFVRTPSAVFSFLRLTSALAAFLFALVTIGSFSVMFLHPSQTLLVRDQSQNAAQSAPLGMGGGGGGSDLPMMAVAPPQEKGEKQAEESNEAPAVKELVVTPLAPELTTASSGQFEINSEPDSTVTAEEVMRAETANTGEAPATSIQANGTSVSEGSDQQLLISSAAKKSAVQNVWTLIMAVQIGLAALALITGLAAIYLRRNPSR